MVAIIWGAAFVAQGIAGSYGIAVISAPTAERQFPACATVKAPAWMKH